MQKLQTQVSILSKLPKWKFITLIVVGSSIAITIPIYYFLNTKTVKEKPLVTSAEPKAITALGRLEPEGEVINISAPNTLEGARVKQLLIKEGDWVKAGQIIAILMSNFTII